MDILLCQPTIGVGGRKKCSIMCLLILKVISSRSGLFRGFLKGFFIFTSILKKQAKHLMLDFVNYKEATQSAQIESGLIELCRSLKQNLPCETVPQYFVVT